jgi:hypothetical protein
MRLSSRNHRERKIPQETRARLRGVQTKLGRNLGNERSPIRGQYSWRQRNQWRIDRFDRHPDVAALVGNGSGVISPTPDAPEAGRRGIESLNSGQRVTARLSGALPHAWGSLHPQKEKILTICPV